MLERRTIARAALAELKRRMKIRSVVSSRWERTDGLGDCVRVNQVAETVARALDLDLGWPLRRQVAATCADLGFTRTTTRAHITYYRRMRARS